jgi:hypothetical protein
VPSDPLGAAILAQVGAGLHPDLATAVRVAVPSTPEPTAAEPALIERYREVGARWRRVYPALKGAGLFAGAP